jgi:alpha-tubulin suppressor-like RCC1 family protein
LCEGPKAFTNGPVRIGSESDWTNVFAGRESSFGIKRDGSICKWGTQLQTTGWDAAESNPVKLNLAVKGVRAIISEDSYPNYDLILDETGNLWGFGAAPWHLFSTDLMRVGNEPGTPWRVLGSNWEAIAALDQRGFAGIKFDGSLWQSDTGYDRNMPVSTYWQFGKRTDWVAVRIEGDSTVALARDGAICRFGQVSSVSAFWRELLAPVRRVTWSVNVLEVAK